jgi:endoglucanase
VNHANQVIPAIRANDKNNIIVVGTPSSSPWLFPPSQRLNYTNVVYTLHLYMDVFGGVPQEQARAKATTALSNGIPMFVSEYGTASVWPNETLQFGQVERWHEFFDQYFISHTNWCMSDIPGTMSTIKAGSTSQKTPAQIGAIVADSAYFTENGIFVNQRFQNSGTLFQISTKPH